MNFIEFLKNIDKDRLFDSSKHKIATSNILIDQSNQSISEETYRSFQKFIDENNFVQRLKKVQKGEVSNISENKPATHFQYRTEGSSLYTSTLNNLRDISNKLRDRKTIIFFGIGGSYLAPNLLNQVFGSLDKEIIFITGSDPDEYKYLKEKSLEDSAFILATKSFSTTETLNSYESVTNRNFLSNTFVVTSNIDEARHYGISDENIIPMDSSMGGRFSIWGPN
jgi:Glucose-6-phosphate isomerase